MMTERHPAIGRDEILPVIDHERGRGPVVIEHEHFGREPFAVKTVANG